EAVPEIPIIASGGLRTGMDIAKSIALGAFLGGMASPFLKAATQSESAVIGLIRETGQLIRTIMFGVGARDLKDLKNPNLLTKVQ
ncbi:MAG: alpha-hydroxy-acid oxidizing protein, partial [Anaerolineales bacterium]